MQIIQQHMDGDIAVLTVDNPPVNAISAQMRQELWQAVGRLDADPAVRAVLLTCAGRTFIAGADVREFGQPPVEPHLPDLVDRIERAEKPWIAAIHGTALGGGLEIAMGCRFRVALPDAKLGLPEVNLGIIPGASGTVRTPRLIGAEAAIGLVASGRPWRAQQALTAGLIDAVVEGDLTEGAVKFARAALSADLPLPVSARPVAPLDASVWDSAAATFAGPGKQAQAQAIESLRYATEHSFDSAMRNERRIFVALRDSDQAAALRHVFFAERAAPRPPELKGVTPRGVARVGIVGGGTMGAGIAVACRNAGLPVVMVERDEKAAARGLANIRDILAGSVKRGKLTEAQMADRLAGVEATADYARLAPCDLVIEAVFEEIGVKRAVFAELARVCRADAVLATNTSYLDPRRIFEGVPGQDRCVGLHFFSPAHIMKLLEIVPTPDTAPDVLATAFALAGRLGKMPVRAGICEGFIGNRIFKRYRAEAEKLLVEGHEVQQVDAAARDFGFRMGPFEAQDLSGLDIAFLQREGLRAEGQDVPDTLSDRLVRAGRKGQKTAGGWYDYAEGDRTPRPSAAAQAVLAPHIAGAGGLSPAQIAARLVDAMADEGQKILAEGIASRASDIDLVEIHGYGFPRWTGGPMFAAARSC